MPFLYMVVSPEKHYLIHRSVPMISSPQTSTKVKSTLCFALLNPVTELGSEIVGSPSFLCKFLAPPAHQMSSST